MAIGLAEDPVYPGMLLVQNGEPRGVTCPQCGCADLRVLHTRRLPNGRIRRERYCRHCGRVVYTTEKAS